MEPKEYFSEESDHENCSTCSEEETMSEDETPTTSDEEFIVSDAEMEEEYEFEELIEENEKLRKENKLLKKLLIQKSAKLLANRTSLREFLLSLLHHFLPERGFCALFLSHLHSAFLGTCRLLRANFLSFWLGAKPALHRASPLTFVNLLSKRSSTQQALLSSLTPLTHTHSQVYIITAWGF